MNVDASAWAEDLPHVLARHEHAQSRARRLGADGLQALIHVIVREAELTTRRQGGLEGFGRSLRARVDHLLP